MAKQAAVLAVDSMSGSGLFQYVESFVENNIPYKIFSISDDRKIRTDSGVTILADDIIANLKGHENEYGALILACGDAISKFPKFVDDTEKQYNKDLVEVMKAFSAQDKIMAGHCGAGLLFDTFDIAHGKKVAVHPYVVPAINNCIATGAKSEIDGNIYTAQTEHTICQIIPPLIEALKK